MDNTLPRSIAPMLARPGKPFDSGEHLFEVKWDGMRALAYVDDRGYRIVSRHGNDITDRFTQSASMRRCLDRLPLAARGSVDSEKIDQPDANALSRSSYHSAAIGAECCRHDGPSESLELYNLVT